MSKFNLPFFADWPCINSEIPKDNNIEEAINKILCAMTLEEKVGQMIQPDLRTVTPEDIKKYKIGSILNGGGAWPGENKYASALDWANEADKFWLATESAFEDRPFRIPFIWATDAVHGHNNVFRATVFPHNIGLGAARDPELIHRIGEATALEVVATGLDWTFAPTVATPRDLRWGRVYEGYSENPEITHAYAHEMVKGLQGDVNSLKSDQRVISNVKHWVGDGGTETGVDRGINAYSEEMLINVHAAGYFSGLSAGAQVVMSSFNSWVNPANYDHANEGEFEEAYNGKLHGSHYLLTDVLKEKMGFDGLIVTDWNGHAEVNRCSDEDATYAINAGNDVLMVPVHWLAVYQQTLADVQNGTIPMSRINDAVTRILRVKMRAGLWDKPQPSLRTHAGNQSILGCPAHRELAREAVRKSIVLLKNKEGILPLRAQQRVILTGSAADDLQKQTGGWSLTWQGDENTLDDFPGATTMKAALEDKLGVDNVIFDPKLAGEYSEDDVAVVVFGEDPYAEMMGDIKEWQSLDYAALKKSYREDVLLIRRLHSAGVKTISVFFSGRPLYVNEEISKSDAFVAAWLPGSEGAGIVDVLVGDEAGMPIYDFQGTLSYSWPAKKLSATVSGHLTHIPNYIVPEGEQDPEGEHAPLFGYGYGLQYSDTASHYNQYLDDIPLDEDGDGSASAKSALELFGIKATIGDYQLKVLDVEKNVTKDVSRNNRVILDSVTTTPFNYQQQQDAALLDFVTDKQSAVYVESCFDAPDDLSHFRENEGYIAFEVYIVEPPQHPVMLTLSQSDGELIDDVLSYDITKSLPASLNQWMTVQVPIHLLDIGTIDFSNVNKSFVLQTKGGLKIAIANIRWDFL